VVTTRDVIVVTGAASGIGEELAVQLAREWTVVAADVPERLPELRQLSDSYGVHAVVADVTRAEDINELFRRAVALGPLSGAVSCAGVTRVLYLTETEPGVFDYLMAVNLRGHCLVIRAAVQALRSQARSGSVVVVSSINGMIGLPDQAVYTAAKAGVNSLVGAAAVECGPDGIRVNAIAPGLTRTRGMAPHAGDNPEDVRRIPMRRVGQPRDMVGPVRFLLTEESAYVTGCVLTVDGGLMHVRGGFVA
jgi:NAD(P)-dependent dehydrogenase (short-subunit alcohol dehydrogenase family)